MRGRFRRWGACVALWAGLAVAQTQARSQPAPCGQPPTENCRTRASHGERRVNGCALQVATVDVGMSDDSTGAVELRQQLEVSTSAPDGGTSPTRVLARRLSVEGSAEDFAWWNAPAGLLLSTSHSVYPPGADYELGPMDTATSLAFVVVEPTCRLSDVDATGEYVDETSGERLALSSPTQPHDEPPVDLLRLDYSSTKRPKPVRLSLLSFEPGRQVATVAFKDGSRYRVELAPGALVVTPFAGGKPQRFVKK